MIRNLAEATDKWEAAIAMQPEAAHPVNKMRDQQSKQEGSQIPSHVQSIKSVSSHTIPVPNSTGTQHFHTPTRLDESAEGQSTNLGKGLVVPEHKEYDGDLQNSIRALKQRALDEIADPGIRQKVMSSLKKADDFIMRVAEKGWLKVGKKIDKTNVNRANIIEEKRRRGNTISVEEKAQVKRADDGEKPKSEKKKLKKSPYQVGDTISADPKLFDSSPGSFSRENLERQIHVGEIIKVWQAQRIIQIKWLDKSKSYLRFGEVRVEKKKDVAAYMVLIMAACMMRREADPNDKALWPKDFFQAMMKSEWRDWVEAVKKEIESWLVFNAITEIPFLERKPGSSIVPLGELYTRKRDGTFKFRQYLMGNMLKHGKDFDETFSSCISWDGIRWCAAICCATGKVMRGMERQD
jgi:hypothetical protein